MSKINQFPMVVSTDATGAGTVTSSQLVNGYIVEVRLPNVGSQIGSSTADWAFTRQRDGGTIIAIVNTNAPFQVFPARRLTNEAGGTTAYSLGIGPVVQAGVPIDDYLVLTVAQAAGTASGTLFVSVDGEQFDVRSRGRGGNPLAASTNAAPYRLPSPGIRRCGQRGKLARYTVEPV